MKKNLTILVLVSVLCLGSVMFCMFSCGAKQSESKTEGAGMNDSIQGTFFGASFGASKDEVIDAFAAHDLVLSGSTEESLNFSCGQNQNILFEDMIWESVNVLIINGSFYYIDFYRIFKDKAEALSEGQRILNKVSQKYNLIKEEPKDTLDLMKYAGINKDFNREVDVLIYGHDSLYVANLIYSVYR